MLKADFHVHTKNREDSGIKYSDYELIDYYASKKFDVIAITSHDEINYSKKLANYAKKKGILLIPGVEATIEGKHILIINTKKIPKTFAELKKLKSKNNIILAPHAFFLRHDCIGTKLLLKHIKLFDGIEYSHFYLKFLNFNKKAVKLTKKFKLALVGTSDCHCLEQIEKTYTLVDSKKNIKSVIKAIKNKKVKLVTRPLTIIELFKIMKGIHFLESFIYGFLLRK